MSAPDVLERVRMCVAEAGYDPDDVTEGPNGHAIITIVRNGESRVSWDVAWRARNLAGETDACQSCWDHRGAEGCLADRRLVTDCGRER